MSFFESDKVAKGYSEDRIYLHPEIIQKVKSKLSLDQKLKDALDVGCGAGLSTLALKDIAENIVGVDSSKAMIKSALEEDNIEYFNYSAEYLPFNQKFDIITLAGSINWVNRALFFSEAKKIIKEDGFVIIYDIYLLGAMEGNDEFSKWYQQDYLNKYPKPPRDESPLTEEESLEYGFLHEGIDTYRSKGEFSLDSFKRYMFTQSNITSALENRSEQKEQIEKWFDSSLTPFFNGKKNILFGGYIVYLRNCR